jgi:choline dehydrogenase-like flavoprotein
MKLIDPPKKYDAVIVGTGAGGGTIGFALAKKGLKVLFVEKGLSNNRQKDLRGKYTEAFKLKNPKNIPWKTLLKQSGRDFEKILESNSSKIPFIGAGVGGSTALFGMAMERFNRIDFVQRPMTKLNKSSTLPPDGWPISFEDLLPYYKQAEVIYKVKGTEDPLKTNESFGYNLPPKICGANQELFEFFNKKMVNPYVLPRSCEFVPGCNECQGFLCSLNCKNDSNNICIQPAINNYNAELLTGVTVTKINVRGNKVTGIECIDKNNVLNIKMDILILAGGAISTPSLLLKSKNNNNAYGISNQSGMVGENLMRHCIDLYLIKTKNKPPSNGFLKEIAFNDFYNTEAFGRLGTFQSFGRLPPSDILILNLLEQFSFNINIIKRFLFISKIFDWYFTNRIGMNTIIEDLPYKENTIEVDRNSGVTKLTYKLFPYEKKQIQHSREVIANLLSPYSYTLIKQAESNKRLAHVCGTCRMGTDPKTSVVNEDCKSHEIDNLYISDSSVFPTSGGTNPALTIIANGLRIADKIS